MKLRWNILANYISQLYATAIGVLILPLYLKHMGAEAYGLVAFFSMLQAWFTLLDIGLTPTLARETARYNAKELNDTTYANLTRTLEIIFWAVGLLGSFLLIIGSDWISKYWLNFKQLPDSDALISLKLISVIIGTRWISGLYRSIVNGFERLIWLSTFNIIISTLRFIFVIPVFLLIDASPITFFSYQLSIAALELFILILYCYKLLPNQKNQLIFSLNISTIKPLLKFSLSIAFTSSTWVLITQTDKLALSKILSLSDYGFYTIAVLAASSISLLSTPISNAIMPRMANLNSQQLEEQLIAVYRSSTQIVMAISAPAALILAFFSKDILLTWTGDRTLAETSSTVLSLYAVGYLILGASAFPYYLQFSKGNLKLHLWGSIFFALFFLPTLILTTGKYGILGAGWAWLIANTLYFMLWVPLIHRKLITNLHYAWLLHDVLKPCLLPFIAMLFVHNNLVISTTKTIAISQFLFLGLFLLLLSTLSCNNLRPIILKKMDVLN